MRQKAYLQHNMIFTKFLTCTMRSLCVPQLEWVFGRCLDQTHWSHMVEMEWASQEVQLWIKSSHILVLIILNRGLLISGVFFNFRSANFTIIWLKSPLSKTINRKWHFLRLIVWKRLLPRLIIVVSTNINRVQTH